MTETKVRKKPGPKPGEAAKRFFKVPGLKRVREREGYSVRELAEKAGVAPDTVHQLEHGRGAQPKTRRALAMALGVGVREISEARSNG